jgi:hypothetical protein
MGIYWYDGGRELTNEDRLLNRKQAAAYLMERGCAASVQSLTNMAARNNAGGGPPFTRFRKHFIRYSKADLDAWVAREVKRVE